jgi:hypothetical protein
MLLLTIKKRLYLLPERLMLRFGRAISMDGIRVVIFWQSPTRAQLLTTKMARALHLIQSHAPKYYARVQKCIPNILIFGAHAYDAVHISELKLCDLSRDYALSEKTTASHLAMTLVHEATHGYLDGRGTAYQEQQRGRIERICVQAEIALARTLPDSAPLLAEAESRLNIAPEFWSSDAFAERDFAALKSAGGPQWLITYLRKRRARLTQQSRSTQPRDDA